MAARVGTIIYTEERNKHITGNTQRITTNVIAGWCGIDLVERVTFDLNTAGTLRITIGDRKYKLTNIRKSSLLAVVRCVVESTEEELAMYAVK